MRHGYKLFAGATLLALLLTGCGPAPSSQSSEGSSGTPLTEDAYTITWKNYDGAILETDRDVKKGAIPTYDGVAPTRPNDTDYRYTWNGWDPQVAPVAANQTYTATYSSERLAPTYTIDFDLNGGTSSSYAGAITVEAFSKDIFFFDCAKEGWNFRGWSYNGVKVIDEKGNLLTEPAMSKTMTFVAEYSQTAKMTILSNMEGAGTIAGEGEYPFNTYIDISARANQGYVFMGWYHQNTLLSPASDYKFMLWDEDVTLEARFKLDVFALDVHSNNDAHGLVLLRSPSNNDFLPQYQDRREYKSQVMVAAHSKTDVRFLGWYDGDNKLVESGAVYSFAMPNHDYVLEAKWNDFKISYNLNGGINDVMNPTHYSLESVGLSLREPTRPNYDFLGWQYKGEYVTEINPAWLMNVELTAVWEAHAYSISYELGGGTNDASNPMNYTVEGDAIPLKAAARFGYEFAGWYTTAQFSEQVTEIARGSHGDLTLYAKWIPVAYSITYQLDGGVNAAENPTTYTIESAFRFADPSKGGYAFVGWFDEKGAQIISIKAGSTGAMTLTARWSPIQNFLSITSQDEYKGTVDILSGTGYTGETITVAATPAPGCFFEGWYQGLVKMSNDMIYTFTMPNHGCSLVAHFSTPAEAEEELRRLGGVPKLSYGATKITYGLYPQANVNDPALVSVLNTLTVKESNGWYLYNKDYYAKLSATPTEAGYKFENGTTIVEGQTYWFKCEPILWDVLDSNQGQYYIVSNTILDQNVYYGGQETVRVIEGQNVYENNYKYSDIRAWLNADFYNAAFALDNTYVRTATVDNRALTTESMGNPYVCPNTEDKVFLPSYHEYLNASFGFTANTSKTSTRECKTTDWARARGLMLYSQEGAYANNAVYWTRSPSSDAAHYAWNVSFDGSLTKGYVGYRCGVRPGIAVRLP